MAPGEWPFGTLLRDQGEVVEEIVGVKLSRSVNYLAATNRVSRFTPDVAAIQKGGRLHTIEVASSGGSSQMRKDLLNDKYKDYLEAMYETAKECGLNIKIDVIDENGNILQQW